LTKKTEIALDLLDGKDWNWGRTWSFLDVEENITTITVKIKHFGNKDNGFFKLKRAERRFANYTIEPIELTFLDKVENIKKNTTITLSEEKKIVIDGLSIVYQDLKNEIPNLDEIFYEGAEIKLKLKNNPNLSVKADWFEYWFLKENDEETKKSYELNIFSDYKIITSAETISFPLITFEERWGEKSKELKEKWSKEEEKWERWYQKVKKNPSLICLNSKGQFTSAANPSSYQVEIEGENIDLTQIIHISYYWIKDVLVKEIGQNIKDWKIKGEVVKNKNGRYHSILGLEKRLGNGFYDDKIIDEWLEIKKSIIKRDEELKNTNEEKILSILTNWEKVYIGYRIEGFLSQVSKLISLLKSETESSKKIKELESFLKKYKSSDTEPLTQLVKEWKKMEGMEENTTLNQEQLEQNNFPWKKVGKYSLWCLGILVVILLIWWGIKKISRGG
jgi:hypothetical protein